MHNISRLTQEKKPACLGLHRDHITSVCASSMEPHAQTSSRRLLLGSCLATMDRRYLVIRRGDDSLLFYFPSFLFIRVEQDSFLISFSLRSLHLRFSKFPFFFDWAGPYNLCQSFFSRRQSLTLCQNGLSPFYSYFSCSDSRFCRQRLDKTMFFGGLRIWYVVLFWPSIFFDLVLDLPATSGSGASGTLKIVRIRAWLGFFLVFC